MSAQDFTSLWLEEENSFYSFKAEPPWAVLSWVGGEDTFSIEFKINTAEFDLNGQHITYRVSTILDHLHIYQWKTLIPCLLKQTVNHLV